MILSLRGSIRGRSNLALQLEKYLFCDKIVKNKIGEKMIIRSDSRIENWVYDIIYGSNIFIIDSKPEDIRDYKRPIIQ